MASVWRERSFAAPPSDRLPEETLGELRELLRLGVPGNQPNWPTVCEIARLTAQGCPSASWLLINALGHSLIAARLPAHLSGKVFANRSAPFIATASAARGTLIEPQPEGGLRITGRFLNSSGIESADWVLLKLLPSPGAPPIYAVCQTDVIQIERDWNASGLLASGTHSLAVDKLALTKADIAEWQPCLTGDHFSNHDGNYLGAVPLISYLGTALVAPILGCAESLIEEQRKIIQRRMAGDDRSLGHEAQALGESLIELRTAQLIYSALVGWLHERGTAHMGIASDEVKARRAEAAYLVRLCRSAAARLQEICGMGVLQESSPAQRFWRDLQVMSAHSDVRANISLLEFGQLSTRGAGPQVHENERESRK